MGKDSNQHTLIINVESVDGIQALDDLFAIDGLDAVLIGPHDLSCSLGIPEQYDHPDFLAACETIFIKARAAGIGAGIHFWGDLEEQIRMLKMGANLLIHSADILLFQKHLSKDISNIKVAIGAEDKASTEASEVNI
jgi:4-hydroxy-2-oxoheptanedioate aldolase